MLKERSEITHINEDKSVKQQVAAIVLNNEVALKAIRLLENEAKLSDALAIYVIEDKVVPANSPEVSEAQQEMAAFARKHNLEYVYGRAMAPYYLRDKLKAGDLVLSGDPDILMVGAVGALGLVVEAEELAEVLRTGVVELPKLKPFVVELEGVLTVGEASDSQSSIDIRDLAVFLEQELQDKVDKDTVIVFHEKNDLLAEKSGAKEIVSLKSGLSIENRMILCGWCQKLGVKSAYFTTQKVEKAAEIFEISKGFQAAYALDLSQIPQRQYVTSKVNAVFIGGAYGGTLEAIKQTADILAKALENGQKVAYGLRLNVAPASTEIYAEAADRGYHTIIMEAQGMILNQCALPPVQARIGAGEVLVSNDIHAETGYAGENGTIYLASTKAAVEAALNGFIGGEA